MMRQAFLSLPLARKAASLAVLLCLLVALVLILASQQGLRHLITQSSELFGESLVRQLSRDASAPLVQGDKLSLQALLNELIKSPLVVRGAIYDVENRPIAEAGTPVDGQDISASITFQDSIAGYAVITFDTRTLQQQVSHQGWQLVMLALLLAALAYVLALVPGRHLSAIINDLTAIATTPLKLRRANAHSAWRGDDELRDLTEAVLAGPPVETADPSAGYAVLAFEITNLPSLRVNLGSQALAGALQSLQRRLKTVGTIYDGEMEVSRSHCFTLCFSANQDTSDYPFRALCSAYLIQQSLAEDEDLPFRFRQAVTVCRSALAKLEPATGRQMTIEDALHVAGAVSESIALSESAFHHPSIESRVVATNLGDGVYRLDDFLTTYRQLLERQLQTLRNH